ncbi:hyaluronan mediated motility receptor isoform X2 [Carcharodon carcharias]|uniref:hyaluronan mediated motility receptor isoform X2 n=1 Tax=Carcharodon carcharias TaxID=13397 RepID=UPI001B7E79D2|nr:hyaluronan mediated motility receptor isoform X2 [Carcharodon carcharias]
MSFPRAAIKRFNDRLGCAPAPGHYDIKEVEGSKGPVSFEKAHRFKKQKDPGNQVTVETEKGLISPASSRKNLSFGTNSAQKDATLALELKKQKMLEQEIRCLLQQRGEQDKRLQALEEEVKKVESKLTAAVREKTSLTSTVVSLERQLADLHKANELLKTKFSDDGTKKKINALCLELIEVKNKTDAKDKEQEILKEISYLQISLEGQVKLLQADLEASKATVTALQERNGSLEEMHQETKAHNENLEIEMDKFHALTEELREENKVLQAYLDNANEQIQDLHMQLSSKVNDYESKLEQLSTDMEEKCMVSKVKQQEAEKNLLEVQSLLKKLSEEVAELQGKLATMEQEKVKLEKDKVETEMQLSLSLEEHSHIKVQLERSKGEISQSEEQLVQKEKEILNLNNCLKQNEVIHCEQIKEVNEKCQQLEQEKERVETECNRMEQSLTRELAVMKEKLNQMEQDLQQKGDELSSVKQEKELSDSLSQKLDAFQEEMTKEKLLLEEELEGALDELEQLQLKELEAEELAKQLEKENELRARDLAVLRGELAEKNAELEKINENHSKIVSQLREEQSKSLRKLGDTEAEFESYKLSVTEEVGCLQESNTALAKEVALLQYQTKDKQQQLAEIQLSKEKAKEEYARMLLEAQTKLAQKEAEVRKLDEACNLKVTELQGLLEQSKTCQEVEKQSVAVGENMVAELKAEIQKWQVLYEELHNKVKPFQAQLDSFEREKNSLLNEHGATQEELNKLSEAYVKLLGHQNQKQKIKHVMKLKQENVDLKQELTKLRAQLSKEKLTEQKYPEQRCKVQGTKRFDPAKAFKHAVKENIAPTTPLREGNTNIL